MQPFAWLRASNEGDAVAAGARGARFVAGGTTLVDLMKQGVERPSAVVDIGRVPLARIEATPSGGLRIGALATNTDVAYDANVASRFAVLSQALLSGASPQLRNLATVGGNLLQRTRCPYFRDLGSACNKRAPGRGCDARGGFDRSHAVLGTSDACIATHPSDMCVALVALDAVVLTRGPRGARAIAVRDFHTLPGAHPDVENLLEPGELVTHVELPAQPAGTRSVYSKVRDRESFAFALASAAVVLHMEGGTIRRARVALGGVATKPWRSDEAERELVGKAPRLEVFASAASAAMHGATAGKHNAFKIALAKNVIASALARAAGLA
ncbi:MAG TPA: xanthine dehydrogenase family protein subunit M [Polyangiaceae bacterium]